MDERVQYAFRTYYAGYDDADFLIYSYIKSCIRLLGLYVIFAFFLSLGSQLILKIKNRYRQAFCERDVANDRSYVLSFREDRRRSEIPSFSRP